MPSIDWQMAAAIATVVSSVTFAASAIAVVLQLRQTARGHYFSVTSHLFEIWQSPEFQYDQLFLLHKLGRPTWEEFCAGGRGEQAERAIHRVGGYYDRVGNLVKHHLINKEEILPTIGGYAVAVWYRIQPLVKEMRLRENAVLFQNYESLLPECHECYVPGLEHFSAAHATSSEEHAVGEPIVCDIPGRLDDSPSRTNGIAKTPENFDSDEMSGESIEMTSENIEKPAGPTINAQTWMAPDLSLPDSDGVAHRLSEFTSSGPAVMVYARGAWCPFCLRQLSDYAERYGDFKRAGIEVVALSPESLRKSRRLRTTLKLPFTVLSDAKFEAAKSFGLLGQEPSDPPSPATIMIDRQRRVMLSTRNEGTRSLLARDMLDYARTAQPGTASAIPPPQLQSHRPGWLFARGLANLAVGLVSR